MSKVDAAKWREMKVPSRTDLLHDRRSLVRRTIHAMSHPIRPAVDDLYAFPKSGKAAQIQLSMQYRAMMAQGLPTPKFEDVEFRTYSQFGEDGILLYIFSVIGTTNKKCVEICGGGGIDNTTNLIINQGWNGMFFDGNERKIRKGQQFYARCADTKMWPPKLVHTWVSAENINELLEENGYIGEVDLLSLDMDGIDYWVWKAIESINPRVVVLEYNNALGPDLSVTVPYKADFVWQGNKISMQRYRVKKVMNSFLGKKTKDWFDNYYGASLTAFAKLGKQKGYRLIGCEHYGINAFFIREDIGEEILPEIAPSACFNHPFSQYASEVRRQTIANREWIEV
jgi:hypothetical protein